MSGQADRSIRVAHSDGLDDLDPDVTRFVGLVERRFRPQRDEIRRARQERRRRRLLADPSAQRPLPPDWKVPEPPENLRAARITLTGQATKKMIEHGLSAGADAYLADFEDSLSPTWANVVNGHQAVREAVRALTASKMSGAGRWPQLFVRPRSWHLDEKHAIVDGAPVAATVFDTAIHLFNNADALARRFGHAHVYIPKIETRDEAKLWRELLSFIAHELDMPLTAITAGVIFETVPAALDIDGILYELRTHAVSGIYGGWDYLFSVVKILGDRGRPLPTRQELAAKSPWLDAYAEHLVATVQRRGALALGGVSAYVPGHERDALTAAAHDRVREEKLLEWRMGYDGTHVAHPALIPTVAAVIRDAPRPRQPLNTPDLTTFAEQLLATPVAEPLSEKALRHEVDICLRYFASWLSGAGSMSIDHELEGAARAELCRMLLWHWAHHPEAVFDDGSAVTVDQVLRLIDAESAGTSVDRSAQALLQHFLTEERATEYFTTAAYDVLLGPSLGFGHAFAGKFPVIQADTQVILHAFNSNRPAVPRPR